MPTTAVTTTRRPAEPADDALLRELFVEGRPELSLIDPGLRDQLVDLQLRAQEREYAAAYPQSSHQILVADGAAVGRLILDKTPDAVRVVDVSVLSRHQRRGIGSSVLREVIDEAERGGRTVRLSVWWDNGGARRLYESLGFVAAEAIGTSAGGYLEMARSGDDRTLHR